MAKPFSIFLKLAGLIGAVQLAAVATLAGGLTWREAQLHEHGLHTKAETYGGLVAEQVRSAVAFDDQETAREIFDAVSRDSDIDALALYGADNNLLYGRGDNAPAWTGAHPDKIVVSPGEGVLVAVAPVVSLEGPKGTLVLRLSTAAVKAGIRARAREGAMAAGVALLVSLAAAALIARRLSRRIGHIARAAEQVAGGDLGQQALADKSGDELGVLARGFDVMVARLRSLVDEIRSAAEHEQVRLEGLVSARTAELDIRNKDLRRVLDTVEQGLVLIDRDGKMSSERSAILDRWFGAGPDVLWAYLAQVDAAQAAWFEAAWSAVLDDILPIELTLAQMPRRLVAGARTLDVVFQPIHGADGVLSGALVVVTDISDSIARERAQADERETIHLLGKLLSDREGVLGMLAEAATLMASILDPQVDAVTLARTLHTLKGNAGQFGLESVASLCHAIETRLADVHGPLLPAERAGLSARWDALSQKVALVLDRRTTGELHIDAAEYAALRAVAREPRVVEMIESWSQDRVSARLDRCGAQAKALAERLGQPALEVIVEADAVRAPHAPLAQFWPAVTHVIRNAVDHGARDGQAGRLVLGARRDASGLVISVRDHGPGIPWAAVRESARSRGLPHATHADLEEALFHDGLSTRSTVTTVSGRGVGLSALRAVVLASGGRIAVESDSTGTCFRFIWPASALVDTPAGTTRRSIAPVSSLQGASS